MGEGLGEGLGEGDGLAELDDPVEQRRFTRNQTSPAGEAIAESSLRLCGMN